MRSFGDVLTLLGRLALGGLFLWSGITRLLAPAAARAAIARTGIDVVHLVYAAAVGIEIGAALLLMLGWKTRFAAGLLALWCVFIAWLWHFHPTNPNELMLALRDLALAAGLAQFALHGAGRFSLDRR